MTQKFSPAVIVLLCSGMCLAVPGQPRKPAPQKQAQMPSTPAQQESQVPAAPPSPENMPATPPQVAMNNGMLSITADNSTLGDVLNGVQKATGATVDVPPAAAAERVVVHIAPGEPRQVLQELLTGSKFDYIIVGSPQNDNALQKVILTPRTGGGATPAVAANRPPAYQPPAPPEPEEEQYNAPDVQDEQNAEDNNGYQPEPASPEVNLPPQPESGPQAGQPEQDNQQGPKTPEQLLQELQRMRGQQGQQPQRPDRNPHPQ